MVARELSLRRFRKRQRRILVCGSSTDRIGHQNAIRGSMRRSPTRESAITLVALLGLLVALGSNAPPEMAAIVAAVPAISPAFAQASKSTPAPTPIKLLKVEPVKGYVGDSFTVVGNGFTPGQKVDFFWSTVDGAYSTKVIPDNVEYHERKYEEKRLRLGGTLVDPQGRVNTVFTAPR